MGPKRTKRATSKEPGTARATSREPRTTRATTKEPRTERASSREARTTRVSSRKSRPTSATSEEPLAAVATSEKLPSTKAKSPKRPLADITEDDEDKPEPPRESPRLQTDIPEGENGLNADGFNADGFNAAGFNADGFNAAGFNAAGCNKDELHENGQTPNVYDIDYDNALRKRNIFIAQDDGAEEVLRRAHLVISNPGLHLEDVLIREIMAKSSWLRTHNKSVIFQQLGLSLVPQIPTLRHQLLNENVNQAWSNSVPVPRTRYVIADPPPLPKPAPTWVFGYSKTAFEREELDVLDLLVDDSFYRPGPNYAVPDKRLIFPFLAVEVISQAEGGTHYVAMNEAAGTGAIAMNGVLDLYKRCNNLHYLDYDEPLFFSVTMDHETAHVNVHYLGRPKGLVQEKFHVKNIAIFSLKKSDDTRALVRAIENILNYGLAQRLENLHIVLEVYRLKIDPDEDTDSVGFVPDDVRQKRDRRATTNAEKNQENVEQGEEFTFSRSPSYKDENWRDLPHEDDLRRRRVVRRRARKRGETPNTENNPNPLQQDQRQDNVETTNNERNPDPPQQDQHRDHGKPVNNESNRDQPQQQQHENLGETANTESTSDHRPQEQDQDRGDVNIPSCPEVEVVSSREVPASEKTQVKTEPEPEE